MSRLRRKMFILLFIFIIFVSMFIMAAFLNSPGRLTPLKDTQGNIIPGSVSEKVWIDINGIKQGMFIRGEDIHNPVLLYCLLYTSIDTFL